MYHGAYIRVFLIRMGVLGAHYIYNNFHKILTNKSTFPTQMLASSNPQTDKQQLKKWFEYIKYTGSQITAADLAHHICLAIIEQNKQYSTQSSAKYENQVEMLWKNNEYFYQSMIDVCEDLIYFVFAADQNLRKVVPRCVVGYYEIAKNIVHPVQNPLINGSTKKQSKSTMIPQSLKNYLTSKLNSILFSTISLYDLEHQLTKFYDSNLIKLFKQELKELLAERVRQFQRLYGIQLRSLADLVFDVCLFGEGQVKNIEELGDVTLDEMLICLVYITIKRSKQSAILEKIVSAYQQSFKREVNRLKFLNYFNEIFLLTFHNTIKRNSPVSPQLKNSKTNKFLGGQLINQQKSIFDMFEQ